ncbi:MAG: 50S ribosomal protein L9 [Desulfatibacillaceae bacterium]|nr:50S ribosomal protein L9 [Desulfatibacillaceae bacterium]
MKVILIETVDKLGIVGTEVKVARGYARNYLLPKKLAVLSSEANKLLLERKRKEYEIKVAQLKENALKLAGLLAEVNLEIKAKVSEEGRLYGSVSRRLVVEKLAELGFEIERSMVRMDDPIKEVGQYQVPVHIMGDIKTKISVTVSAQE